MTVALLWVQLTGIRYDIQSEEQPPAWLISNVTRWLPLVERWHPDFPELDPALILAIIAQESQGNPKAIAEDLWGSTGLMQVGPRSWTGTRQQLLNPAYNVYVGMRMLGATIEKAGSIRRGVAAYNCGFVSLDAGKCYSFGGYAYADRVLDYWLPIFRAELTVRADESEWLAKLGYLNGLGRWDKREVLFEKMERRGSGTVHIL